MAMAPVLTTAALWLHVITALRGGIMVVRQAVGITSLLAETTPLYPGTMDPQTQGK